jgi:pyroglutamyl-peptidase
MLVSTLLRTQPDAVVMLGESGSAASITIERVALNLRDYRIADNEGSTIVDRPVREGGPAAYFATLPVRLLVDACRATGVPAELSLSAGTFLCNEVMYAALDGAAREGLHIPIGFIHVPQLPEQAVDAQKSRPTMACETTTRAIRAVLGALRTAHASAVSRPDAARGQGRSPRPA